MLHSYLVIVKFSTLFHFVVLFLVAICHHHAHYEGNHCKSLSRNSSAHHDLRHLAIAGTEVIETSCQGGCGGQAACENVQ